MTTPVDKMLAAMQLPEAWTPLNRQAFAGVLSSRKITQLIAISPDGPVLLNINTRQDLADLSVKLSAWLSADDKPASNGLDMDSASVPPISRLHIKRRVLEAVYLALGEGTLETDGFYVPVHPAIANRKQWSAAVTDAAVSFLGHIPKSLVPNVRKTSSPNSTDNANPGNCRFIDSSGNPLDASAPLPSDWSAWAFYEIRGVSPTSRVLTGQPIDVLRGFKWLGTPKNLDDNLLQILGIQDGYPTKHPF
jgi:hypothetical protein